MSRFNRIVLVFVVLIPHPLFAFFTGPAQFKIIDQTGKPIAGAYCIYGLAQESESIKTWQCLNLLDEQTKAALARQEEFFAGLFRLPSEYNLSPQEKKKQFVTQWLNDLQADNPQKIVEAAAYLGIVKANEAVAPIEKLLASGKCNGRLLWVCTRTLGQTGNKNSIPILIDFLDQKQKNACVYARVALAEITGVYYGGDKEKWKEWQSGPIVPNNRINMTQDKKESANCSATANPLPSVENPLAKKVLQKYQSINTYHAIWTMTLDVPNPNVTDKLVWEVAFDRPTKRVLFFFGSQSPEGKQSPKIGQLFIADGKMMHTALSAGNAASGLQKQSIPIADLSRLTYRDMRKGVFFRPFDLPLMFSELHFMEVIESQIKEIRTLDESESLLRFEVLPDSGETSAVFCVDPETLLIQKFNFIYHSGQGPVFKIKTIEINQPLDNALFDFEKRISQQKTIRE